MVNDPRLAFAGKVGLGPFWTLIQALFYSDLVHVSVNYSVSSFRHERISTVEKIYTRMQCKIELTVLILVNYNNTLQPWGAWLTTFT
jgi:hypothetical protein